MKFSGNAAHGTRNRRVHSDDFLVIALDVRHNMWAIEQLGEDLHFPSAFLLFSSVI